MEGKGMKYAIIKVINGNFFIHAEGITELNRAKTSFHGLCQTLWNSSDVLDAYAVDRNASRFNVVEAGEEVCDCGLARAC